MTNLAPLSNWRKGAKSEKQAQGNLSTFSPGSAVTKRGNIIAMSIHFNFFDMSCNQLPTVSMKNTLFKKRLADY